MEPSQLSDIRIVIRLFPFITVLLLSGFFAQAQSDTDTSSAPLYKHSIALTFGATHTRVIDEAFTAARLKFTGTVPAIQLDYQRRYKSAMFLVFTSAAGGFIHTTDESLGSLLEQFNLSFSLLGEILPGRERMKLFLGGELGSTAYLRYDEKQLNNVSGAFIHGLYIHAKGEYRINKRNLLSSEILLPGLLFIKRDVSDSDANVVLTAEVDDPLQLLFSRAYVAGPDPTTHFRFRLGYEYRMAKRVSLKAGYTFSSINEDSMGVLNLYNNQVLGGFNFKF